MEFKRTIEIDMRSVLDLNKNVFLAKYGLIYGLISIGVSALMFVFSDKSLASLVLSLVYVFIFFGISCLASMLSSNFTVKRSFKKQSQINKKIEVTLNHSGFSQIIGKEKSGCKWGHMIKVQESKYCFYFYITKKFAFMLPKRFFSETEVVDLRQHIIKFANPNTKLYLIKI